MRSNDRRDDRRDGYDRRGDRDGYERRDRDGYERRDYDRRDGPGDRYRNRGGGGGGYDRDRRRSPERDGKTKGRIAPKSQTDDKHCAKSEAIVLC